MSVKLEQDETPNVAPASITGPEDGQGFDIDDLIPEELRAAADNLEKNAADEDADVNQHPPLVAKGADDNSEGEESDDIKLDDEEANESEEEGDDEDLGDEDVDLSDENLEKLLGGDLDAISKKAKKGEEESEDPSWHTHEGYKDLVQKASYAGFDNEQFDNLIQEISDGKVIENGNYTKGLEEKVTKLESVKDNSAAELIRLREVERLAHFDTSAEVNAKYGEPMTNAISEIRSVLELEGVPVNVQSIVGAKDRVSLSKLLEDYAIDDVANQKLINHWKNYRQLEKEYTNDKHDAKTNLARHLSTQVTPESANNIIRNSLSHFMKADPRYAYIKDAILGGVNNTPEVADILSKAQNNFLNTVQALGNPSDYVHNNEWLGGLSSFMLDAAHNKHIADKYVGLEKNNAQTEQKLIRVVKAYRRLAKSAKGLEGSGNGAGLRGNTRNGSGTTADQDLKEFTSLLKGDTDIMDILPG